MQYTLLGPLTVLEALTKLSPDSSKTTLREWLRDGRVFVDGQLVKIASTPLQSGQTISLGSKPARKEKVPILYEDPHLVVIEKPAGLLSVATHFDKTHTAHAYLKERFRPRKVYVVHRLDQETSGVMLFALSEEGYFGLKELFANHDIDRQYTAVVHGKMPQRAGTWRSYLYEDKAYVVHSTQDPEKGELAITHFQILESRSSYSLLKLTLETGKKNQIRVHCEENGVPIVGDKKYGGEESIIAHRLCLHAHHLGFVHPIYKKEMSFDSPIPEKFYRYLKTHV
ncbi:RluA family pseudouridine synthase [Parachlamydia sp. AcF125]|uniref:RluA family pseudouridine synthase n=1 Tax=Parachlamydia sp. AcF125 TaxID=2795736 RepID=UPI001BC9ED03|nr:RluA family pseudouridine synthase [Parachlamydia sp. AcF125]MBS4168079.1 Ribosomal large subunit pseudouridine synthase D [Parachlamydia sp. AcF125]